MLQIPDWMDFLADLRTNDVAMATPRMSLTFGQFRQASVAAALQLEKDGIERGQKVAVLAISPTLQMVLFFALMRLGAIPCILPHEATRRHAAFEVIKLDWLLTDNDEKLTKAKVMPMDIEWLTQLKLTDARLPGGFRKGSDICIMGITSGTTSVPKAMGFTVDQMEARVVNRSLGDQGVPRGEKVMVMAALGAMNGMQASLGCLWCGGTVYMGWTPENAMEIVARDRIERIFSSAPLLLRAMDTVDAKQLDVSCLKQVHAGGDSISPDLMRRVMKHMTPNLFTGFSTNEVGRIALTTVERMQFKNQEVGTLFPWAEAQAVNDKDEVLPPGVEGHLRFRGPGLIDGYIDNPKATKERFRDGWFYSDDIGWVTENRMLVVSGRTKEFINIKGDRFNPTVIDHAFASHPTIVEAAAFGVPKASGGLHDVWLAVVARTPMNDAELQAFCNEKFGSRAPRHFLRVKRLPRNEAGKVMRHVLQELAQKNQAEA